MSEWNYNDEIADVLARTLDERRQLLKIMSMNHYDLEENSRIELLTEFKASYGKALKTVMQILERFRPDMDFKKKRRIYLFLFSFYVRYLSVYGSDRETERSDGKSRSGVYI